jgi:hypothetical protein
MAGFAGALLRPWIFTLAVLSTAFALHAAAFIVFCYLVVAPLSGPGGTPTAVSFPCALGGFAFLVALYVSFLRGYMASKYGERWFS